MTGSTPYWRTREDWKTAWRCARMYFHQREPECWQIAHEAGVTPLMHEAISRYANAHFPMYSGDILRRFKREREELVTRLFWEHEAA